MGFYSILFERPEDSLEREAVDAPAFFADLHLDQIIAGITAGKEEYRLTPLFYASLHTIDAITYRQEIMRDLEDPTLLAHINSFARRMRVMREHLGLAEKLHYKYQKERWFVDAVDVYCEAVTGLVDDLTRMDVKARGLLAFRDYLTSYTHSSTFTSLHTETRKLLADLSAIRYCLLLKDNGFKVQKYESEIDYSVEVQNTFEKFQQGAVNDYRVNFAARLDMNHVEAKALEFVAQLYPDTFRNLDHYCATHSDYLDTTIAAFDREIQFYVGYLDYVSQCRASGLKLCYPELSDTSKDVYDYEAFDLALAQNLIREQLPVVCNDFYLKEKERILVVSGPNQGGKTTFARMFGQVHYLASLGCPVPGGAARLFHFDRLFTHFEKEEDITTLRGKLEDDLIRIREILEQATTQSILILNELFTSTTMKDAIALSRRVMDKVIQLDALCVWVTFVDELASCSEKTVSMVSTVVHDNPAVRTYKIVRRPADGLAYAFSLAEKYRLTYECLKARIAS
jgi:DNA mismatch repair protein MutS